MTDTPPPHNLDCGPTLRTFTMPGDANPYGDIFGGWLMGQMDVAGAMAAMRRAGGRVSTVAVDAMEFHKPVFVGDEVSCFAHIERVGTTSIRVKVESWARRPYGSAVKVTQGVFTYVALGEDRKPRPVPPEAGPDESRG